MEWIIGIVVIFVLVKLTNKGGGTIYQRPPKDRPKPPKPIIMPRKK